MPFSKLPTRSGLARWLLLASLFAPAPLLAQAKSRLPIIAGNGRTHVLVEVDGTVKTWGAPAAMDPGVGLGDGKRPSETREVRLPRPLAGVQGVIGASVGMDHVLLLKRDGTVWAWGYNDKCQLGTGNDKNSHTPIRIPSLHDVRQVVASEFFSAVVLGDGSVWMWGDGDVVFGNGETRSSDCLDAPTQVQGLGGVQRVVTDGNAVFAIKEDGTLWAWGRNRAGQLCDGTKADRARPAQVRGIGNVVDVAVSGNSFIVLADGTLRACGQNTDAALGDFNPRAKEHLTPFAVPGFTTARSVRTNEGATIVTLADGTLRAFGNGYHGALGDGHSERPSTRPVAPVGLGPVLAHYMSQNTSFAIRSDGTVMAWCLPAPEGSKSEFVLTPAALFTVELE